MILTKRRNNNSINKNKRNEYMSEMKTGEKGKVTKIEISGAMRRRLQDLGLIEGTCVECVQDRPCGGPNAYLIRGAVIAIRSCDSRMIHISGV